MFLLDANVRQQIYWWERIVSCLISSRLSLNANITRMWQWYLHVMVIPACCCVLWCRCHSISSTCWKHCSRCSHGMGSGSRLWHSRWWYWRCKEGQYCYSICSVVLCILWKLSDNTWPAWTHLPSMSPCHFKNCYSTDLIKWGIKHDLEFIVPWFYSIVWVCLKSATEIFCYFLYDITCHTFEQSFIMLLYRCCTQHRLKWSVVEMTMLLLLLWLCLVFVPLRDPSLASSDDSRTHSFLHCCCQGSHLAVIYVFIITQLLCHSNARVPTCPKQVSVWSKNNMLCIFSHMSR